MKSSAPPAVWDEKHTKALLGLRRHPASLIQIDPWHTWIDERGGLNQVREMLRTKTIQPEHRKLLNLLLDQPHSPTVFYAAKLHIAHSSYFLHLDKLLRVLLPILNNWPLEPAQRLQQSAPLTNLPASLTSLVGAEESIASVVAMLKSSDVRLLTLTGPGGVGKTRLAIAAGRQLLTDFADGVFFIPLETINDPQFLHTQIVRLLDIETSGVQSMMDTLKNHLRKREMLLILDNFEQLIESGLFVNELLAAAAGLKVLVTSREALNIYGEYRFNVPELSLPAPGPLPPLEQLNQIPAISLFVKRVQARHPAFNLTDANKEAVVGVCNRFDGLPLAIELAATQVKVLAADQALPQLEISMKAFRDISRDRPARQKTLWGAIDWSYQLLSETEQALFRRLSVFGREWDVKAAQAVCQIDDAQATLEKLTEKSLVRYANSPSRFEMLQAVREYALDQLANKAETERTQRQHANYFLAMVERAEPAIGTRQQLPWMHCIRQERENLQIALQWMLDQHETEMAFRLLGAAWRYYNMLNMWDETKAWMDRALAQGSHLRSAGRAKALWGASWLTTHYRDFDASLALGEEGLKLAREMDDPRLMGLLLQNVADGLRCRGESEKPLLLLEESLRLFNEMNNQEEIAWVLYHIADTMIECGERARGMEIFQQAVVNFRAIGDQWGEASTLRRVGALALEDGNEALVIQAWFECLNIFRLFGARQIVSVCLYELASFFLRQGNFEPLSAMIEESLALAREVGNQEGIARALHLQGKLALRLLDFAAAGTFFVEAQAIFKEIGDSAGLADTLADMQRLATAKKVR